MRTFLAASMMSALAGSAMAQSGGDWDMTGQVYLWGAAVSGTTSTGQSIDLDFSDIVDKLDFALMGSFTAQRDQLFTFADLIHLRVSEDKNAAIGPGVPVDADARIKGTVLTAGVGYDMARGEGARLATFAGTRALKMDTTVNLGIGGGSVRRTSSETYWDVIVGLTGYTQLSDDWGLSYYADVGAGETDLTWQTQISFDREFDAWTLSLGYRYMAWELPSSSTLADVSFSGPVIGAKFTF